jgi:hypothetical protein
VGHRRISARVAGRMQYILHMLVFRCIELSAARE